jgi:predicted CXXCH cytochrome family protein
MNPIGYSKKNFLISIGFLFLIVGILTIVASPGASAEASPNQLFRGAAYCSQCHKSEYINWNSTAHAKASGQGGTLSNEGVTCEVCHGPDETMSVNASSAFCRTCHSESSTPTYMEWQGSSHAQAGVGCVNCHDPMSSKLTEDSLKLCGQCHTDKVAESQAGTHGAEGYDCLSCHMVKEVKTVNGTVYNQTGHTFIAAAPSSNCKSCHKDLASSHGMWGSSADDCLTCHSPVEMTKLHLLDGTSVPSGDGSVLCGQCHLDKFTEMRVGTHGDPLGVKNCTDCHRAMHWDVALDVTLPPIKASLPASTSDQVIADVNLGGIDLGTIQFGTIFTVAFAVVGAIGLIVILRRI